MSRTICRSLAALVAATTLVAAPRSSDAWNTGRITPTPPAPDPTWVRSLPTHQWIMWQAIEHLRRNNHPLAELFARNFDALANGNHYADHHCDADSGIPNPGHWIADDRLGKPIVQEVTFAGITQASVQSCADVVTHFPMRAEVGFVEEIWDDTQGDDLFAPATAAQEYADKIMPTARSFAPGWFQQGRAWQDTQPHHGALPWLNLGSYRPIIRIWAPDADQTPMGWVRAGGVPREYPAAWPPFVASPEINGHRNTTAPQALRSSMFYLGWVAHLIGDSAQIYHRQRSSGPFHGGFEGDVDAMIRTGAFDAAPKQFPIDRQRQLVLPAYLAMCPGYDLNCLVNVGTVVATAPAEEIYAAAAQFGVAAPQARCNIPFDLDASPTADAAIPNAFGSYILSQALGAPRPTIGAIVQAAAGPAHREAHRCQEWSTPGVWMDFLKAADDVGDYLQDPEPVFNGQEPSREMLAAFAADNLSRAITATAVLFAVYGADLLESSAGHPAVFDASFYASANTDVAARAGGTSQGALVHDWLGAGLGEGRASSPAFDLRHYAAMVQNPLAATFDGAAAPRLVGTLLATGAAPGGGTSPAFHPAQYRALNPGLAGQSDVAAMRHFGATGLDGGLVGSVLFDARAYRARYADAAGLTPRAALAQWLSTGLAAGRAGAHGFDPRFYLAANPDVAAAVLDEPTRALRHFAAWGIGESRPSSPAFDPRFYGAVFRTTIDQAGIALSVGRDLTHWQRTGIDLGLAASPAFDAAHYRAANPSLGLTSARAALDHWLTTGIKEARASSPFFDVRYYLANNADLASQFQRLVYDPFTKRYVMRPDYQGLTWHWLRAGIAEGRRGSAGFDPAFYRASNPDVELACRTQPSPNLCSMAHFARAGRNEGRLPVALPSTVGAAAMGTANDVVFSYGGPIAGLTCVAITEAIDPHGWSDNYLCSVRDLGLRWSSAGPIAGMTCTLVNELADPNTWNDNYLCAPAPMGWAWSMSGPLAGRRCAQFLEPGDPHTWNDNYLCR